MAENRGNYCLSWRGESLSYLLCAALFARKYFTPTMQQQGTKSFAETHRLLKITFQLESLHHPPIHHLNGAITGFCKIIVMGHGNDRLLVLLRKLFQNIKHHLCILGI